MSKNLRADHPGVAAGPRSMGHRLAMRALTWQGKRDVSVETVPDLTIQDLTDAIVRVTSTAICGSDLHLDEGLGPFLSQGDVLSHEAMGVVEEVGSGVPHLKAGDRVVVPFNISCGSCWMCSRGLYAQCETIQNRDTGKGAALFGYTSLYGSVPGGQAELLRVPQAHFGPIKVPDGVPDGVPDERYLYLSDILPTAWQAVAYADTPDGGTLAVIGLGPVGQLAARIARHHGIERVIGVDLVPERVARAPQRGLKTLDRREGADVAATLLGLTDGRGPDAVIEAVGTQAHGSPVGRLGHTVVGVLPDALAQPFTDKAALDRTNALTTALKACRRGGTVSISGVYGGEADPFPMMEVFDRGLQLRMGQCHVRRWTCSCRSLSSQRPCGSCSDPAAAPSRAGSAWPWCSCRWTSAVSCWSGTTRPACTRCSSSVVSVLLATIGQLALVGALAGASRWLSGGTRLSHGAVLRPARRAGQR